MTFLQTVQVTVITATLTLSINSIFHYLKNKLDWLTDTKKFKREYSYDQLRNLYLKLYAIICQSEYLRFFYDIKGSHDTIPFIEIEKRNEIKKKTLDFGNIDFNNFTFNTTEYEVSDAITEFNKKKICEEIIQKSEFASQVLLKLAVAYRFVQDYYTDDTLEDKESLEKFQDQELVIICKMIKTIIVETNKKLKQCNMEYSNDEIKTGEIKIKF